MSREDDNVGTWKPMYANMTLREYFAGLCLQGLQAQHTVQDGYDPSNLAHHAVVQADALLLELSKEHP